MRGDFLAELSEIAISPEDPVRNEKSLWLAVLASTLAEAERSDAKERRYLKLREQRIATFPARRHRRRVNIRDSARRWLYSDSTDVGSVRWILEEALQFENAEMILAQIRQLGTGTDYMTLVRSRGPSKGCFTSFGRKAA